MEENYNYRDHYIQLKCSNGAWYFYIDNSFFSDIFGSLKDAKTAAEKHIDWYLDDEVEG